MKPVTIQHLQAAKHEGRRIVMVTAYDHLMAGLVDEAGVDAILVGDSVAMVVQGRSTTLGVSLDEMIYHCRCVTARPRRALVIGDLPFGSYQPSVECAVRSACRLMGEGGVGAVKLEGGAEYADRVEAIVRAGIPVMGHVGMTPQSVHRFGGYKVQGRRSERAREILEGARALEEAGGFAIVLEKVPEELAAAVTRQVGIPTIGIGAGRGVDGQVLVTHDLLGLFEEFQPRFVKRFADLAVEIRGAVSRFAEEVRRGEFPDRSHAYQPSAAFDRGASTASETDNSNAGGGDR